ncbi:MAG TPA: hypothetical protein VGQ17_00235 [Gemmatimonadales bacterium]|jgi:hypothetical protein|nr:hypothetical protein [Gemmatimonadales bacterium]
MRRHLPRTGPVLLSLCAGLLGLGALSSQNLQNPSLAGTWKLNAEKSDRPEEAMREAARPEDPANPGKGFSSGGGRPRVGRSGAAAGSSGGADAGAMGGGRAGGSGGGAGMAPLMLYVRPLPQLLVEQTDSTLTLSDPTGTPRTFHPDGRKVTEPMLNEEQLELTAKWKSAKLVVERKLGTIGTIKETYLIDPAARQLIVLVNVSSPRLLRAVELRRVYDPAGGEK